MAKTKAQIVERVARKLGKLAIGQVLEADIAEILNDSYDQVFDSLEDRGLSVWASNSVPDRYVAQVVALVAVLNLEGIPASRQQVIAAEASRAELSIANINNGTYKAPHNVEGY